MRPTGTRFSLFARVEENIRQTTEPYALSMLESYIVPIPLCLPWGSMPVITAPSATIVAVVAAPESAPIRSSVTTALVTLTR